MNVITVSREYGAGGGETARRLAQVLGWQLLDRELLHQAAQIEHVPDAEIERMDEQAVRFVDRLSFHPAHKRYMHGLSEAVRQAATRGNVVLVGRGARQILGDAPGCFHLRLVAPLEWRARRMAHEEDWTLEQARGRCQEVDRTRRYFNAYFFGSSVEEPDQYDLVVNTGRVPLDLVADLVREVVQLDWPAGVSRPIARRVLTLARQLGAGERSIPRALMERLELEIHDRGLLDQEAIRLGIASRELEQVDEELEHDQRSWEPGSIARRYREALAQRIRGLAGQGDVLLVGRGASGFLHDHPTAFHVRLVARPEVRHHRVVTLRKVDEETARRMIIESDRRRHNFHKGFFNTIWEDPLEYHLTVNVGRLGQTAVELIAQAANRYWGQR